MIKLLKNQDLSKTISLYIIFSLIILFLSIILFLFFPKYLKIYIIIIYIIMQLIILIYLLAIPKKILIDNEKIIIYLIGYKYNINWINIKENYYNDNIKNFYIFDNHERMIYINFNIKHDENKLINFINNDEKRYYKLIDYNEISKICLYKPMDTYDLFKGFLLSMILGFYILTFIDDIILKIYYYIMGMLLIIILLFSYKGLRIIEIDNNKLLINNNFLNKRIKLNVLNKIEINNSKLILNYKNKKEKIYTSKILKNIKFERYF